MKSKVITGVSWQFMSLSISTVMNIGYLMIMARLVSPEAFGVFAILNILLTLVLFISEMGLGSAIIQYQSINKYHKGVALITSVCFGMGCYGLLFLFAPYITAFYDGEISTTLVRVIGLKLITLSFYITLQSQLVRQLLYKTLFIFNAVAYFIGQVVIGTYLAYIQMDEIALIGSIIAYDIVSVILYLLFFRSQISFKWRNKEFSELIALGAKMTLMRIMHHGTAQIDKLLIGKWFPMAVVGTYERSQRVTYLPVVYLSKVLDGVVFSTLSRLQSDLSKLAWTFSRVFSVFGFLTLYISVMVYFAAPTIVALLLGEEWTVAIPYIEVLAFIIYIKSVSALNDTLIRATDHIYYGTVMKVIFVVLLVLFMWINKDKGGVAITAALVAASAIDAIVTIGLSLYITKTSIFTFVKDTLMPNILFVILLVAKNWTLQKFTASYIDYNYILLLLILLSDLLLFLIYILKPNLIGIKNLAFILSILKEVSVVKPIWPYLDKVSSRYLKEGVK